VLCFRDKRYLKALAVDTTKGRGAPQNGALRIADGDKTVLSVPHELLFCYRDGAQYSPEPIDVSRETCISRARTFLLDNALVDAGALRLDRVVTLNRMVASREEVSCKRFTSSPHIARYRIIFKRRVGSLPLFGETRDTIAIEIGRGGRIVSLTSSFRNGRPARAGELVKPCFRSAEEARRGLAWWGTVVHVAPGMFPTDTGSYVPAYMAVRMVSGEAPLQVGYFRQDTLDPLSF
jgi:hypothetical protein